MVEEATKLIQEQHDEDKIAEIELPDENVRKVLAILQPVLVSAIKELHLRGYPGWASWWEAIYLVVNDVMRPNE